ncbi:MAG: ABC transporter ATP-binding protein, partial [Boseongicola sp.]
MARRKEKLTEVLPSFWHVIRYFAGYIHGQRMTIGISIAMVCCGIVVRLLEPWPLKFVIDRLVFDGRPEQGQEIPALGALDTPRLIALAAIAFVVIAGLRAVSDYVSRVGFFVVGNRAVLRIRDALFRRLLRLSLGYHGKSKSGDMIIRVTRDVSLLRDVTSTALLPLVVNCLVLAGILVVICFVQWRLALVALAIVPIFWITSIRIGRRIRKSARKQRQREGAMASLAAESLGAIQVLQTYGLEDEFATGFSGRNRDAQKEDLKAQRLSARLGRIVDVLLAFATAAVMWYGAHLVLRSQMTPGDLLVFLFYLKRAFKPAQDFAKYTARLAKATAAGERVIEVMQRTPE